MNKLLKWLCILMLCFSVTSLPVEPVQARNESLLDIRSGGLFDDELNSIITSTLTETEAVGDSWRIYLNGEFKKSLNNFSWATLDASVPKWSGGTSNGTGDADPRTNSMAYPKSNSDGVYEIYFPEQLSFALANNFLVDNKIILMNNMDMNGSEKEWNDKVDLSGFLFDGGGHTIYNIGSKHSFITSMKDKSVLKNITFESAKLVSEKTGPVLLGIVGDFTSSIGNETQIQNVSVRNSVFFSSYPTYNPMDRKASYVAPLCESKGLNADQVSSINNTVYAVMAHAGGAFGIASNATITNSYSVDTTVVAGGNHSGGFISCSDGGNAIQNSFTNNTVLGNKETGVFIGALMDNNSVGFRGDKFENCYTAGSIEGQNQLGGFVGHIDTPFSAGVTYSFKNCYSTSIVGMQKGGTNLGGFVGSVQSPVMFENCYSAGEVGSIDTDTSISNTHGNLTVGGFLGSYSGIPSFKNTYYDKQTTAMREWESGATRDYLDSSDGGLQNIKGIKGVLTSDSNKFGNGLAAQPKTGVADFDSTTGFTGLTGDVAEIAGSAIVTNPDWVYDGGNTDPALHNCMYPQLKVFFENEDPFIRAYSYASAATVHEQVWNTSTYGDQLPNSTYDTVRDLTLRFTLTSYVDNVKDSGVGANVDIKWTKSNSKSNIYGLEKPIIGMFTEAKNSTYNRDYWTADKFSPGVEWVKVEFQVTQNGKTSIGSRRLRIIPTSNINSGSDQIDIVVGDTYNHAKDMYMAYSTAQRMAVNKDDITTGVYPDTLPFDSADPRAVIQDTSTTDVQNQFQLDKQKFNVGSEHLTKVARQIGIVHPNNAVNVYLYGVKTFQETDKDDVAKIVYGTKEEALLSTDILQGSKGKARQEAAERWAKKLTGETTFEDSDIGRYMIEYEWVMPDGRFMRDSKMIMVQAEKHTVSTKIVNTGNLKPNNASMLTSLDVFSYDNPLPAPTFTTPASEKEISVDHGNPLNMVFKPINTATTIDKIDFEFTLSDISSNISTQTIMIENIEVDKEFEVPISYYYTSYEENGNYYAKKEETIKKYVLRKNAADGYFYLTLDAKFEDINTGLQRFDVECDVKATIYVSDPAAPDEGEATFSTQTFLNGTQIEDEALFEYEIIDSSGTKVREFEISSKATSSKKLSLPIGTYTVRQVKANGYTLENIQIDGMVDTTPPYEFTITKDSDITIQAKNVKMETGKATITTKTFVNGVQLEDMSLFKYQILDDKGLKVKEFEIDAKATSLKEVKLPVGTYTVEQVTSNGYTLECFTINGSIIKVPPYHFTVEKDGHVSLVAKNNKISEGKVTITTNTFENGNRVYLDIPFQYQIFGEDNQLVKKFEMTSADEDIKEFSLAAGDYRIEAISHTGYTLENMNINGLIVTENFSFTITSDFGTSIIAKQVHMTQPDPINPDDPKQSEPGDTDELTHSDTGDMGVSSLWYILLLVTSSALIGCLYLKKRLHHNKYNHADFLDNVDNSK